MIERDPIDRALRDLPPRDADGDLSERVRTLAHRKLARAASPRWTGPQALLSAVVTGVTIAYVGWALAFASSLAQ
jgi:hypothetical protein